MTELETIWEFADRLTLRRWDNACLNHSDSANLFQLTNCMRAVRIYESER